MRSFKVPVPRPIDIAIAVIVGIFQVVGCTAAARHQFERAPLDAIAYTLLVIGPVALLWKRTYPIAVLITAVTGLIGYGVLGYPYGPFVLAAVVAVINAVLAGRRWATWIVVGAGCCAYLGIGTLLHTGPTYGGMGILLAWLIVLLSVAEIIASRRAKMAEARRAATADQQRKVTEERLRLARELHDVLAHNISLINVQAGTALHLLDTQPEQARPALTAIKQASKETLQQLRSTLGVLRQVDESAPRAPAPGLAGLPELVDNVRAAGLTVRTEFDGEARVVPAAVDLAAYRIVQEALTNVVKHAGGGRAVVSVGYAPEALTLRVDNDGSGTVHPADKLPSSGAGITGMRERATAVGGSLTAGPHDGGFRVSARLPLEES